MTVALILWTYALVIGVAGPAALRRAGWVDRAPRLAIAAWQALSFSIVFAVAFGGLALVVPAHQVSVNLAELLESCAMALSRQYANPGGSVLATAGIAVATLVSARWLYCSLAEFLRSSAVRRRHRELLSIVGRADDELGVIVLDDDRPFVYCIAGRRHQIVMTRATNDALDPTQLSAVLAHEHAHLRGRHHLAISAAAALARAFPWAPVFGLARDEITRLVELVADDQASRSADRFSLAEAMLNIASGTAPAGALAAGGSAAGARVRRLIIGHRPLAVWTSGFGLIAAAALVAAPLVALATPAVMAGPDCCTTEQPPMLAADQCSPAARHTDCTMLPGVGE